jgi:hypothetical protein
MQPGLGSERQSGKECHVDAAHVRSFNENCGAVIEVFEVLGTQSFAWRMVSATTPSLNARASSLQSSVRHSLRQLSTSISLHAEMCASFCLAASGKYALSSLPGSSTLSNRFCTLKDMTVTSSFVSASTRSNKEFLFSPVTMTVRRSSAKAIASAFWKLPRPMRIGLEFNASNQSCPSRRR